MKLLKNIICVTLILALLPAAAVFSQEEELQEKQLFYKWMQVENSNEPYFVDDNGELYVQIRLICETLGIDIAWDGEAKAVVLDDGEYEIPEGQIFRLPCSERFAEGEAALYIYGAPVAWRDDLDEKYVVGKIVEETVYFPARALESILSLSFKISDDYGIVEFSEYKDYTDQHELSRYTDLTDRGKAECVKTYETYQDDLKLLMNFFSNDWRFNGRVLSIKKYNKDYSGPAMIDFLPNGGSVMTDEDIPYYFTEITVQDYVYSHEDVAAALERVFEAVYEIEYTNYGNGYGNGQEMDVYPRNTEDYLILFNSDTGRNFWMWGGRPLRAMHV